MAKELVEGVVLHFCADDLLSCAAFSILFFLLTDTAMCSPTKMHSPLKSSSCSSSGHSPGKRHRKVSDGTAFGKRAKRCCELGEVQIWCWMSVCFLRWCTIGVQLQHIAFLAELQSAISAVACDVDICSCKTRYLGSGP